jgi:hypothetical protein
LRRREQLLDPIRPEPHQRRRQLGRIGLRNPGPVRRRAQRDDRPVRVDDGSLRPGREIEKRRTPPRLADLDDNDARIERVCERAFDLPFRVVDDPPDLVGADIAAADADVGRRFRHDDRAAVAQPARGRLGRIPEIEDLAILLAVDVDDVDLAPGRVPIGAPVEDFSPGGVEPRQRLMRLQRPRDRDPLAGPQILTENPGRADLLPRRRVDIRAEDKEASGAIDLSADREEGWTRLRQGRRRTVESHTEKLRALVAVIVGADDEALGIKGP